MKFPKPAASRARASHWPLAALAALALACDSGSNALVVQINDGGVLLADLARALDSRVEDEGPERRQEILGEELDRLVAEELALARARNLGIDVGDAELDDWLERLHGERFADDDAEYRSAVRRQMAGERAAITDLAELVHISEDAIATYFEENRPRWDAPAKVQIRQIVVPGEKTAQRLHSELHEGADFAAMSESHSVAPEASSGGLLPPFSRGELPEVFDLAFELGLDEISDVLQSPYGFHIFLLVARLPAQVAELGDVREQIAAELQARRLAELRRTWLRDLRRDAKIRVNERLLGSLR